jgi:hypothetical protein
MYHYRGIGGFERLMIRHEQYVARMSQFNKKYNMGYQYLFDRVQKERDYNACLSKSTVVL